ncbi:MAG: hypothetical protein ACREQZ_11395, partial [Woeseiaceae bacterium]
MSPIARAVTAGFVLAALLMPLAGRAGDEDAVASHLAAAEAALEDNRYKAASEEYRKAALLSDDVEVARQATRVSYSYGFNEDALAVAERWFRLDPDDDEALLYV